jgi:hypothetical protein
MASTIRGNDNFDSAGPFGSLEFLSETNITSDVAYIDISFPTGYRGFYLAFNQMSVTGSNTYGSNLNIVLKDSSGNLVTNNGTYCFSEWYQEYWYNRESWPLGYVGHDLAENVKNSVFVTIMNPRDADIQTSFHSTGGGFLAEYGTVTYKGANAQGNHRYAQDNSGIRVSVYSKTISSNSHSYAVWGIK